MRRPAIQFGAVFFSFSADDGSARPVSTMRIEVGRAEPVVTVLEEANVQITDLARPFLETGRSRRFGGPEKLFVVGLLAGEGSVDSVTRVLMNESAYGAGDQWQLAALLTHLEMAWPSKARLWAPGTAINEDGTLKLPVVTFDEGHGVLTFEPISTSIAAVRSCLEWILVEEYG